MNIPEFSFRTRAARLGEWSASNTAAEPSFDAVIVGGGIVGVGLARELALRGKSVALFEKSDFASGTSSKSSKLIHGGLRYLEMFDFHLVFEALSERHWLLKTHPHLVQPLEFVIPIYDKSNAPKGTKNSALLGMGLWLYDALSLFRTPFFHGRHEKKEMLAAFPGIKSSGMKGGYYYADAMMLDDELVLETLLDAERHGAKALNYVEVTHVGEKNLQGLFPVNLRDSLNPDYAFKVQGKEVIVCVGPWTEKFGDRAVQGGAHKKLRPSKGVHLVFPWKKFPVEKCLVMAAEDGRIIFAIPRRDLGPDAEVTIVGTTDSLEKGDIEGVKANGQDEAYLLHVLKSYFPEHSLTPSDIASAFAGVRPLIDDGAASEAKTSREHEIWKNSKGIVFMAGGKYTTFRKISQEIADFTFGKADGKSRRDSRGLISSPAEYQKRFDGERLWGKFTTGWVRWKIRHHSPMTLEDIVFRRLPIWLIGKELSKGASAPVLEKIAKIAAEEMGWSAEKVSEELQSVRRKL